MTEQTETRTEGLEFAETFIGECITGTCGRPATVRVWEDFILCALHHTMHEVGGDQDEAGIGLELVAGWLSVATMHGNGYLQGLLGYAKDELLHRKEWAGRRMDQLRQVEHENVGNDRIRLEMGKARQAREEEERQNAPATEPPEEAQTTPAARMAARKSAMAELAPEQQEHGYRLLLRSDALSNAAAAVLSEDSPIAERKAETLAVLTELRDEANAEFGRFREEVGVPGF